MPRSSRGMTGGSAGRIVVLHPFALGVPALAVVESFDVLEDRPPGRLSGREAGAVHEFVLEAAEEALHGRVVEAVPAPAHRAAQAVAGQDRLVGSARILPGFKGSSQRLPASIVAPRQRLRRAFSSQGSFAVWH